MGKFETLRQFILDEIRLGCFKPGQKLYSRAGFMEKFGCARATVDKVITDLASNGVLATVKGGGTFVARPALRKASAKIAMVAPILGHPSMPQEIIHGFLSALGAEQDVRYYTYDELKHPRSWDTCRSQRGIVFIQPDVQHSPLLNEARTHGIPHLVLYRDPPESPFVSINNTGAVARLVETLHQKGRARIAYIGLRQGRFNFPEQRYAGYLEGLLRSGLALRPGFAALLPAGGERVFLDALFALPEPPDAVIADLLPLGHVIEAAAARGLAAGRDVLLARIDEVPAHTYSFPVISLKKVTTDVGEAGARAFLRLLERPGQTLQEYIVPPVMEQ